jgi:hypothetical protein
MTSEKQRLANQRNAQKSTGPKTPAGKAAIAHNNLKHGLCSTQTLLPFEDSEEYAALLTSLRATHQPGNEQEDNLVRIIAHHYWRLNRHFRVEAGVYTAQEKLVRYRNEIAPHESGEPNEMLGIIFWQQGQVFEHLRRYETTIQNGYYKAIQNLERVQALRAEREKIAAHEAYWAASRAEAEAARAAYDAQQAEEDDEEAETTPENGFESQTSATVVRNQFSALIATAKPEDSRALQQALDTFERIQNQKAA